MTEHTPNQRIQRARRAWAEGRPVSDGDLALLFDRLDSLEREIGETAGLRRRANRNRAICETADRLYPDLGHRAAAERLADSIRQGAPEVAELLERFERDEVEITPRAIGDIIKSERHRIRNGS